MHPLVLFMSKTPSLPEKQNWDEHVVSAEVSDKEFKMIIQYNTLLFLFSTKRSSTCKIFSNYFFLPFRIE